MPVAENGFSGRPGERHRPRVVIVVGGFGGLAAARGLRRAPVCVTINDRTNHHLLQPILYQVANGLLSPGEIAPPLRVITHRQENTAVELAEVTGIDVSSRQVELCDADGATRSLGYDYLVVWWWWPGRATAISATTTAPSTTTR